MLTKLQCFKNSEEERLYLMRGTLITGDAVVYVMGKFRVECLLKKWSFGEESVGLIEIQLPQKYKENFQISSEGLLSGS